MQPPSFSLIFLVLVALSCVAMDNMTSNSVLQDDGSSLISDGKIFELGFFSPEGNNTGRYLGIWYYNFSSRTVVWVANRDTPILNSNGYLSIVKDGNLCLLDNMRSTPYFNTSLNGSTPVNRTLKLLDSGNLALIDGNPGDIVWQSFAMPTDTFLPGMSMDGGLQLVSWRDSGNPALGNFTFQQDQDNNRQYWIKKGSTVVYWKSDQSDSIELPYPVDFFLSNFSRSIDQANSQSSNANPIKDYLKRLRKPSHNYLDDPASYANTRLLMNSSGVIQFYIKEQGGWSLMWSEPDDACSVHQLCGVFGTCNLKSGPWYCDCLPGFKPHLPDAWAKGDFSSGCGRTLDICNESSKPDTFLNLKLMKVGKPDPPSTANSEAQCRQDCLSSCQCQAYYYASPSRTTDFEARCSLWNSELTGLQEGYIVGGHNLSIRVPVSAIETTSRDCQTCGKHIIPYPLSTGPDCGDLSYQSFTCNNSTGQLFFLIVNNSYEVININKEDRRFVVQVSSQRDENCSVSTSEGRQLNQSMPFNVTNWCYKEPIPSIQDGQRIEISWTPPLEPICNSSNECRDWPDSNCAATANDKQKRCLCNSNYKWDNLNLKCISAIVADSNQPAGKPLLSLNRLAVIIGSLAIAVVMLACSISFVIYRRRISTKRKESRKSIAGNPIPYLAGSEKQATDLVDEGEKIVDVPYFSLESVLAATDNFSDTHKLGRGGFGPVYKGMFPGETEIAVKRLSSHSGQGIEEFRNEVMLIAKLQHRNLLDFWATASRDLKKFFFMNTCQIKA